MVIKVKDAAASAAKFVARAQAASGDYAKGVQGAGDHWASAAAASKDSFAAGVQAAIQRDAFSKGIAKAGAAKYVARATTFGAQRYGPGVAGAQSAWQQGVAPYLAALATIDKPPKGPKGSPQNYAIVQAIGTKLRAIKLGQ